MSPDRRSELDHDEGPAGHVVAVSTDATHRFSKVPRDNVQLLVGLGVEGDAHLGTTVQHRSRVARDPSQPNLRQVHLLQAELLDEMLAAGHPVGAGTLGENVLTRGVDLLGLPTGALVHLGDEAVVRLTGLRNPCRQIDAHSPGLLRLAVGHDDDGAVVRRAGVMAVVVTGGPVRSGDAVTVALPQGGPAPLQPV